MSDLNCNCIFKFLLNFRTSKTGKNTLAKPDNPEDLRMPKHDEVCIKNCSKKNFYGLLKLATNYLCKVGSN